MPYTNEEAFGYDYITHNEIARALEKNFENTLKYKYRESYLTMFCNKCEDVPTTKLLYNSKTFVESTKVWRSKPTRFVKFIQYSTALILCDGLILPPTFMSNLYTILLTV